MEKKEENKISEEKILRKYFIVSGAILIIFILLGVVELEVVIERAIRILSFWFILFVSIFVPRRILKRSKKFRYIVLYIRKHYPMMFYYRQNFEIIKYINFFFWYTAFYLERILKYFMVGTKIKWLSPYRKNWEKWEFWMMIILEGYRWVHYVVLYVLKIFYEVVKFFDNATIYKIIRSRILGFMMVTIGYIIIGVNFFICYIVSMLIIAMIYYTLNIYVTYKEWMKKYPLSGRLSNLNWVLVMRGFVNRLEFFSKLEIQDLRNLTLLNRKVIRHKWVARCLPGINKKYGLKKATECCLSINVLLEVEEKTLIAIKFLNLNEEEEKKIKKIEISSNEFTKRFWKKLEWYESDSIMDLINGKLEDNFTNVFEFCYKNFCNLLEFKLYFMFWLVFRCGEVNPEEVWNEKDELIVDYWKKSKKINEFYLGILKSYFEFRDIYKFVKEVEKKIYEEGSFFKFYDKFIEKQNLIPLMKNVWILYSSEKITRKEYECFQFLFSLFFFNNLGFLLNLKEFEEIMIKNNYLEDLKGLKEKGYLNEMVIELFKILKINI